MAIVNRRLSNVERGHGGGRVRLVSCQIKPEAHFVKRRHVAGFRPTIFITLDFAKVTKEASRERFREVWSEEGRETMVKTARTNPAVFFATFQPRTKSSTEQVKTGVKHN